MLPSVKKPHPNRPKPAASIVILEDDLEERFIKGSGNGGQKINKTSSRVQLRHKPTDIMIECQETRSRSQNRKIARQRLRDKLDELYNGAQSKAARQAEKLRKRKQRRRQKSKKKYAAPASED
ncbi:hypothetical protein H4R34_001863 [Dimargaris verticillata]|uniref:Prokaryotic-type class I peptide chain release factors domain-containing protein n=1 Tax=Dimargaris verticillata TaxID=2761393 RepID=A0A9W8EE35_9FUNG|nr:hypothetical protein H4R34_001863 [Dimargaris verticillata]